ncbi:MAG: hypothetical protein IJK89_04615, partial [Clostridia bacterium]|nr:hypothetical protein [Clostridia bacterium]
MVPEAGKGKPARCCRHWILSSWTDSEMAGLERLSRAVGRQAKNRCATRIYGKNRGKYLQRLPLQTMAQKTRFSANRRAFGGRSEGDFYTNRLFWKSSISPSFIDKNKKTERRVLMGR